MKETDEEEYNFLKDEKKDVHDVNKRLLDGYNSTAYLCLIIPNLHNGNKTICRLPQSINDRLIDELKKLEKDIDKKLKYYAH